MYRGVHHALHRPAISNSLALLKLKLVYLVMSFIHSLHCSIAGQQKHEYRMHKYANSGNHNGRKMTFGTFVGRENGEYNMIVTMGDYFFQGDTVCQSSLGYTFVINFYFTKNELLSYN